MAKKNDPDLAPDAVLATDLGDPEERHAKQVAEMGGEVVEIDSFDSSGLDDGSVLPEGYDPLNPAPAESLSDEDTEDKDSEDEDDSSDDTADDDGDATDGDDADSDGDEDAADKEEDADDTDDSVEEEDEATQDDPPKGIPKRRFDEVNEEKKTLRTENARLLAQIEASKPPEEGEEAFDILAGEKEYMDLLLDGDTDAALAKRVEVDAAKEAKWKADSQTETRSAISSESEQAELLSLSGEAQKMFDVFNPDHEDYNQPMLDKVLTFMRGYEASGEMSRGDAFVAGLADVVELYDLMPEEEAEASADDTTPKPTGGKKTVDKTTARKKAHVPVAGAGDGSTDAGAVVPSIDDMTDEELEALPEKTLARLRGDIL